VQGVPVSCIGENSCSESWYPLFRGAVIREVGVKLD
jgi:hypothetical protein